MNTKIRLVFTSALVYAMAFQTALASNYLSDPGFEEPYDLSNQPWTLSGVGDGDSAAQDWIITNQFAGTTTTWEEIPPAGLTGAGNYSLLLSSTTAGNGVGQEIQNGTGFPAIVQSVSGWVYVESGSVGFAMVNPNNNQPTVYASTDVLGQWVYLAADTAAINTYVFTIFALSPNSEFYVDNVDADSNPLSTPEPGGVALLGFGALGLLIRRRRTAR